jgi:glyoxylase-like metal-dependent hydrolase (beta-lactamase superfamily II)
MHQLYFMAIRRLLRGLVGKPGPAHPFTQNRELEALASVSEYPNSEDAVLLLTAQEFAAARREYEGYLHFQRLAQARPERPLLRSLEGMMQARVADRVALFRRLAWVRDAIAKLNLGAEGAPLYGRYVRGLVFAELPKRFRLARSAISDLEFCLSQRNAFPIDPERGIYRALALAYRAIGDARADEMIRRAGAADRADAGILANVSIEPVAGYRFCEPRLVREAEGVYVAEGFDMSNIVFLVNDAGVVVIDAASTLDSARAALAALRTITNAPIRHLIITHAHWDHVGGADAIREPGTSVIAHADFPDELRRVQAFNPPFHWFFGSGAYSYDVAVDRLVSQEETIRHGDLEMRLIPAPSGETRGALFVLLPQHSLLVVGDVFMPYVGAPFTGEGSAEGYLAAIAVVRRIGAERLVHGHPPLTRYYTAQAMPGLEAALRATYAHVLAAANNARSLADLLSDNFLPESLRATPAAVQPFLVVREHFIRQAYRSHGGRWAAHAEGMNLFTRREWATVLDALAGHHPERFAAVLDALLANGDAAMAYEIAEAAVSRYPTDRRLLERRLLAIVQLRERYQTIDPFRSIIYSEQGQKPLHPVVLPARGPHWPPPGLVPATEAP